MLLWCRPHPSLQAKSSCSNSLCKCREGNVRHSLLLNLQTMTINKPLRSRLGGLLSRPLKMCSASRHSLKNASQSMAPRPWHPHLFTWQNNSDQFMPSRLGHGLYTCRKNVCLKIFFVVYSITKWILHVIHVHVEFVYSLTESSHHFLI